VAISKRRKRWEQPEAPVVPNGARWYAGQGDQLAQRHLPGTSLSCFGDLA
jgi:hypothetical protein